jgi:hypothetical protein
LPDSSRIAVTAVARSQPRENASNRRTELSSPPSASPKTPSRPGGRCRSKRPFPLGQLTRDEHRAQPGGSGVRAERFELFETERTERLDRVGHRVEHVLPGKTENGVQCDDDPIAARHECLDRLLTGRIDGDAAIERPGRIGAEDGELQVVAERHGAVDVVEPCARRGGTLGESMDGRETPIGDRLEDACHPPRQLASVLAHTPPHGIDTRPHSAIDRFPARGSARARGSPRTVR